MGNSNKSKKLHLGIDHGTATNRLKKALLFHYVQKAGDDICFRCGELIKTLDEFSVDHKEPWLYASLDLFWNLSNVAFSHSTCNIGAGRRSQAPHGVKGRYNQGCRCRPCTDANTDHHRSQKAKLK